MPIDLRVIDALHWVGIVLVPTTRVLRERLGVLLEADDRVGSLEDGDVLTVIDTAERVVADRRRDRRAAAGADSVAGSWWMIGIVGALIAAGGIVAPGRITGGSLILVVVALVGFALLAGVLHVMRRGAISPGREGAAAVGPGMLIAAAAVLVTPVTAFDARVTVFSAVASAAVYLALLGLIARDDVARAELVTIAVVLGAVAALWGLGILVGISAASAAAITMGAVPLALRGLPAGVIDAPPGIFIDYKRYQQTGWAVRENLPEVINTVDFARATRLVHRSRARMRIGTVTLAAVAAVCAPVVLVPFHTDVLSRIGQITLASCMVLALSLGARKLSARVLRWSLRAVAAEILLLELVAVALVAPANVLLVAAGGALLVGLACAAFLVPIGRGARSLFWSRFGDFFETTAVILSLPAALVAAGMVEFVRGLVS